MVNKDELLDRFRRVFGSPAPRWLVRAPGRVNLIGEHVDYNDGLVLPIAMSQALHVVVASTDDGRIAAHSTAFDQTVVFPVGDPGSPGEPAWGNYVRGVAAMLARRKIPLRAGRLLIHSDVPLGGGVSSSAALEVGVALALLTLAGAAIDPVELALLARQAEHEYAASPCGIMDQFICVFGLRDHALLLDCRSREFRQVPMVFDDTELVVMNTQVRHSIGGGEYPVRQRQCREGLAALQTMYPGIKALRDVNGRQLEDARGRMDDVTFRRCRHVVTEIERTLQAADALRCGDAGTFGRLMTASHESLRDDYQVSCVELDALVELATNIPGCHGVRMTGGGFGGCAIALVRRAAEQSLRDTIRRRYDTRFEQPAIVYATTAAQGAAVHES
ncbi:MAG TPA: galactokinase [Phycisphaerae bacterium]|nr:galactokinase [Phycisphaerae bacterium]